MPSEVLSKGTTVDIWAMELAIGYESWINQKHSKGEKVVHHGKSQQELQSMLNRTKEINEGRRRGS